MNHAHILTPTYTKDWTDHKGQQFWHCSWRQVGVARGETPEAQIADAKRQGFFAPVLAVGEVS